MSTISVALSECLAAAHAKASQGYVAAPVFGRPDVAGAPEATDACMPIFQALGQKTFRFGHRPEAANLVKLSGNFLIAAAIESLGEAIALVSKAGIDKHEYIEMLTSTLFTAPVYKNYGGLIADRKFEPAGFAAPLGQKDIRLALAAAETLRVPLPLGSLLRDRFLALMAQGGDNLDWSAIAQLAANVALILVRQWLTLTRKIRGENSCKHLGGSLADKQHRTGVISVLRASAK